MRYGVAEESETILVESFDVRVGFARARTGWRIIEERLTMDMKVLRRANLKKKIEDSGGAAAVARRLGHTNPSYLGNIFAGRRDLGENAARSIEQKMGWAPYELDRETGDTVTIPDRIGLVISAGEVGAAIERAGLTVSSEKFAELVDLYYDHRVFTGESDSIFLARLLKLL